MGKGKGGGSEDKSPWPNKSGSDSKSLGTLTKDSERYSVTGHHKDSRDALGKKRNDRLLKAPGSGPSGFTSISTAERQGTTPVPGPKHIKTEPVPSTRSARYLETGDPEVTPASMRGALGVGRDRPGEVARPSSASNRATAQRAESHPSNIASIRRGEIPNSRPTTPNPASGLGRSATVPVRVDHDAREAPSRGAKHRRSAAVRHAGTSSTEAGKASHRPFETVSRPGSVRSTASRSSFGHASLTSVRTADFGPALTAELSPLVRNTLGEVVLYEGTRLAVDGEIVERHEDGTPKSKLKTLMLLENQGGTFGFGDMYTLETGEELFVRNQKDARMVNFKDEHFKIKHLSFYAEGIELIGTKGCLSCLGVYFEIKGNRVFCAHFNVLNTDVDRENYTLRRDDNPFAEGKPDYKEAVREVAERMRRHSNEHGWKPKDVIQSTLRFVCPYREFAGQAVAAGIESFLGIEDHDYRRIKEAHGFVIAPGSGDADTSRGQLFMKMGETTIMGRRIPTFQDSPAEIVEYRMLDDPSELQPTGTFYYETGWDESWPEVLVTSEWLDGRVEDYTPGINLDTAMAQRLI